MRILAPLSLYVAYAAICPAFCPGQDDGRAPTLTDVSRHPDGSCSGVLTDRLGELEFRLAVTDFRADLVVDGRLLPPGGAAAEQAVRRLLAWAESAFGAAERAVLETADDVHHKDRDWSFDRYEQAAVVNRLAHYRRIRWARIDEVFRGRGTVRLSFKVRDGLGTERLVLFRAVDDGWARPHLGDAIEPVAIGSPTERWIVQAMHAYTEAAIEERLLDLVWSGAELALSSEPRQAVDVLFTLHDYMRNTSPRLVRLLRARDGGSVDALFVDARGRPFSVWFDRATGSPIAGRIELRRGDGTRELVAVGSPEEHALLMQLDKFLACRTEELEADGDNEVKTIAARLARYREVREKVGGDAGKTFR